MRHVSKAEAGVYIVACLLFILSLSVLCVTIGSWVKSAIPVEDVLEDDILNIGFEPEPMFVRDFSLVTAKNLALGASDVWQAENEISRADGPAISQPGEFEAWVHHGLLDRKEGPAIVLVDGSEVWYQAGVLHREDGPAINLSDGHQAWLLYGVLHNEDGPAVVYPDGTAGYYIDGLECTYEEFLAATAPEVKTTSNEDGWTIQYMRGENLHRLDGPALMTSEGLEAWYKNGLLHRIEGPALTIDDHHEYWVDGVKMFDDDGFSTLCQPPAEPDVIPMA